MEARRGSWAALKALLYTVAKFPRVVQTIAPQSSALNVAHLWPTRRLVRPMWHRCDDVRTEDLCYTDFKILDGHDLS